MSIIKTAKRLLGKKYKKNSFDCLIRDDGLFDEREIFKVKVPPKAIKHFLIQEIKKKK